jgi:hypothetical protein
MSIFVREINPSDFPHLSKRDFAMINEKVSFRQAISGGLDREP